MVFIVRDVVFFEFKHKALHCLGQELTSIGIEQSNKTHSSASCIFESQSKYSHLFPEKPGKHLQEDILISKICPYEHEKTSVVVGFADVLVNADVVTCGHFRHKIGQKLNKADREQSLMSKSEQSNG